MRLKKINISFMICILLVTSFSSSYALSGGNENSLSKNISSNELSDIFSSKELDKLNQESYKQDLEQKNNGFTKTSTEIKVENNNTSKLSPFLMSKSSSNDAITCVTLTDNYTGKEKILNDKSSGMAHFLDVTWNITIGAQTKKFWVASTILNLNPSNFFTTYMTGDKLSSTESKVIERKCYKKYNSIQKTSVWYVETRKVTIKNYVDLYTIDKNKKSIRKSGTDTVQATSEHYSNSAWINNKVNDMCKNNLYGPYLDAVK